ncbi:hypothetical protein HDV00_006589 [Rhizophlyctis rosea]|nr:hypothetical protein HDV00_006589 [Rhizophlyctis rosea]
MVGRLFRVDRGVSSEVTGGFVDCTRGGICTKISDHILVGLRQICEFLACSTPPPPTVQDFPCDLTYSVTFTGLPYDELIKETFTAISHVWGYPTPPLQIGLPWAVPISSSSKFADILEIAADDGGWFWCDVLCIDQSSDDDKVEAVKNMGRVHKAARRCVVLLDQRDGGIFDGWFDVFNESCEAEVLDMKTVKALERVAISDMNWMKRVWTFQEAAFPRIHDFYAESASQHTTLSLRHTQGTMPNLLITVSALSYTHPAKHLSNLHSAWPQFVKFRNHAQTWIRETLNHQQPPITTRRSTSTSDQMDVTLSLNDSALTALSVESVVRDAFRLMGILQSIHHVELGQRPWRNIIFAMLDQLRSCSVSHDLVYAMIGLWPSQPLPVDYASPLDGLLERWFDLLIETALFPVATGRVPRKGMFGGGHVTFEGMMGVERDDHRWDVSIAGDRALYSGVILPVKGSVYPYAAWRSYQWFAKRLKGTAKADGALGIGEKLMAVHLTLLVTYDNATDATVEHIALHFNTVPTRIKETPVEVDAIPSRLLFSLCDWKAVLLALLRREHMEGTVTEAGAPYPPDLEIALQMLFTHYIECLQIWNQTPRPCRPPTFDIPSLFPYRLNEISLTNTEQQATMADMLSRGSKKKYGFDFADPACLPWRFGVTDEADWFVDVATEGDVVLVAQVGMEHCVAGVRVGDGGVVRVGGGALASPAVETELVRVELCSGSESVVTEGATEADVERHLMRLGADAPVFALRCGLRCAVMFDKPSVVRHSLEAGVLQEEETALLLNGKQEKEEEEEEEYIAIVRSCLDAQAEMGGVQTVGNSSALHYAASCGQLEEVQLLVDKGADVNLDAPTAGTPLFLAALNGHTAVCEYLVANGADVEKVNNIGVTPLGAAAFKGHVATVDVLSTSASVQNLNSALNVAVSAGHAKVVNALATQGAEINLADQHGQTPLHWAAWNGKGDVVTVLLDHSADASLKNSFGFTALQMAEGNGHADVVGILKNRIGMGGIREGGGDVRAVEP